jgi:hypothetical protein
MSEIWCQFADVMEEYTIGVQNTVNRTAVGVPMAKVEKNIEEVFVYNASDLPGLVIDFDSVVVDNDNMADLTADNSRVFPRRAGAWGVIAAVEFLPDVTQTDVEITILYSVGNVTLDTPSTVFVVPGPYTATVNIFGRLVIPSADLAGPTVPSVSLSFFWTGNAAKTDLTVLHADMHVFWVSEVI